MTTAALSAELRLGAACCIWPRGEARNARIREAAARPIDWGALLAVVRRQRIAGLVDDGLRAAGVAPPDAVATRLAAAAGDVARGALQLASEALRLQALLDGQAIPALFLKGSALAVLAYGNLAIKQAWDIDLLVLPADVPRVCALLDAAGYARIMPPPTLADARFRAWLEIAREAVFQHRSRPAHVELHWRLSDNRAQLAQVTAHSPANAVTIAPGQRLRTLGDEDLFAYLCLHGAHHGWSRLKWLADLAAWLSDKPDAEVERLYRAAQAVGVGRAAAQALLLCEQLFALKLPAGLGDEMRAARAVRWLVAVALEEMSDADAMGQTLENPLGSLKVQLSHFLLASGLRYWLQELRSKSVGWNDFHRLALPRPLYFLYPVMRMPSWAWRWAGSLMRRRHPLR